MKLLLPSPSILTARSMSRSSNISLSDPSSSRSSGSLLLSNPVHVGEVNNTSNPQTRRLYRRSKHLDQRIRIVQCYLKLPCPVGYVTNKKPSLSCVTINKTIACYFFFFDLYNVSNPCPVQFPEAGQSQFGPLTSRSTPLHSQFAQPLHSSSVSSQPSVAGPPVAPPFGHETHSPAPWQSNIGSTVSSAPGFAQSGTPYYFPLRCRVMWGLVTPTPLIRIKLVRLTMQWRSALGLTLAQSCTPI